MYFRSWPQRGHDGDEIFIISWGEKKGHYVDLICLNFNFLPSDITRGAQKDLKMIIIIVFLNS